MSEEKIRVLKMLEEKRISAAEALGLLEALSRPPGPESRAANGGGRFLRIRASEDGAPGRRVSVRVPAAWSKLMEPLIERLLSERPGGKGNEAGLGMISGALQAGERGKIVDVDDGGSRIEVAIE